MPDTGARVAEAPPPGFARNGTAEASAGRWFDGDHVRWRGGVMQPVGGNVQLSASTVPGTPRDVITWHDNAYRRWAAIGTDDALYAYSFDLDVIYNITPAGVGGVTPPGIQNGYGLNTYGSGLYGTPRNASGTPPPGIIGEPGDWWSMDTFGELLLIVPSQDGRLFKWDPNTPASIAIPVPPTTGDTVPTGNKGVVVTDQRHVVLYGANNDPRLIWWSDQESLGTWTSDVTNLAGFKALVTQAVCLTATKVAQGILLFTTNDVHLMQYVGPPYAYGIVQVGAGCGPLSRRAVANAGSFTAWPSWQQFWRWSGNVQPLLCELKDWFFGTINPAYIGRCFATSNSQFSEVWWDWPDGSGSECNRYLAINYGTGTQQQPWLMGRRRRSAGDKAGVLDYPILAGPKGLEGNGYGLDTYGTGDYGTPRTGVTGGALFQHEQGWMDNGQPRATNAAVYAESGSIVMGEGDRRFNVVQIIVDGVTDPGNPAFGYQFFCREQPFDSQYETATQLYTNIQAGQIDVRTSGRSIRMRVQATRDVPWEIGRPRLVVVPAGQR